MAAGYTHPHAHTLKIVYSFLCLSLSLSLSLSLFLLFRWLQGIFGTLITDGQSWSAGRGFSLGASNLR